MDKIILIGASGHGKVIIDAIELGGLYKIHGFIDSEKKKDSKILEYNILGSINKIPELITKGITKGVVTIGDNYKRYSIIKKIKKIAPGFEFITVIHPSAVISKYSNIGKGTVILANAIIDSNSKVGKFCIINNNANLGHDGIMDNYSSLAPNATLGGNVKIGKLTAISIGANVLQSITINEHTVIGAGALVSKDIGSYQVAFGVPAKKIRSRTKGESYLHHFSSNLCFEVHNIIDKKDLKDYKKIIKPLKNLNPFYKAELLDTRNMESDELNYFLLKKEGTPIAVMPFFRRIIKINNKDSQYTDVVSPYGYSGPLFDNKNITKKLITFFWNQVDQWYKNKNVISEFIRFSLNDNFKNYSGKLIPSLNNVKGKLTNKEDVWSQFKSKVRNNYRKSILENLEIIIYEQEIPQAIISEFYTIYIETMKRNNAHEQYYFPIEYFQNFIINNKRARIIATVYKDKKPISTELILKSDDTLYSYLGGTVAEYFHTRPNDFLKIKVVNWAIENNYKYYILGGGRKNGDNLYKYKKTFFPNNEDLIYYTGRKIINQEIYNKLIAQNCNLCEIKNIENIEQNYFPLYRKND